MFHSIKVSVTLGAAVLIAAPGCCLPNLLCNHSSPSEETVVAGYSSEYVGDYSAVSTDCGCGCTSGCSTGVVDSGTYDAGAGESVVVADDDKYIVGTPLEEPSGLVEEPSSGGFTPAAAKDSAIGGSGSKVIDVVKPPVDLKTPLENALPGNSLPGNLLP